MKYTQVKDPALRTTELMGAPALLTPFSAGLSGSRGSMMFQQSDQTGVVEESDIPRSQTGFSKQLAQYTFDVKMPTTGEVHSIIHKYKFSAGNGRSTGRAGNASKLIIYRDIETNEYGVVELEEFFKAHTMFGMRRILTDAARNAYPKGVIRKGVVLAKSPNTRDDGTWHNTISPVVINLGIDGVVEDGMVVSEELTQKCRITAIGSATGSWGTTMYPVYLYSGRPYPQVGEKLRKDRLIFALRRHCPIMNMTNMLPEVINEPDMVHDIRTFAPENCVDGVVHDVSVIKSDKMRVRKGPVHQYTDEKARQLSDYYKEIVEAEAAIQREEGGKAKMTHELRTLVVYAMGFLAQRPVGARSANVRRTVKNKPVEGWNVEVVFHWKYPVSYGAKLSDRHGCKGVICGILPRSKMPKDEFGNVADVVQYGQSVWARQNKDQLDEMFTNAAARDISIDCREMWARGESKRAIYDYLLEFYEIVMPDKYDFLAAYNEADMNRHVDLVIEEGIYLYIAPDNYWIGDTSYNEIMALRPPNMSTVTFQDIVTLPPVTTREKVLFGQKEMTVLEKIHFGSMAVSMPYPNGYGIPCPLNRAAKAMMPTNRQSSRAVGATEYRTLTGALNDTTPQDIVDIAVNPAAGREAIERRYESETPFLEENLIDREKYPIGTDRPALFFKHIMACMGTALNEEGIQK